MIRKLKLKDYYHIFRTPEVSLVQILDIYFHFVLQIKINTNLLLHLFRSKSQMRENDSQVEKSETRQFLQLAQYCASCNRGVRPVLTVNTVPNMGILLAYYWRSTGAVLAWYSLAVLVKLWSRDIINSWHSTGFQRSQYWLLLLTKYLQRSQRSEQYWLSADCKQNPNTGYKLTWKSRWQLAFY